MNGSIEGDVNHHGFESSVACTCLATISMVLCTLFTRFVAVFCSLPASGKHMWSCNALSAYRLQRLHCFPGVDCVFATRTFLNHWLNPETADLNPETATVSRLNDDNLVSGP